MSILRFLLICLNRRILRRRNSQKVFDEATKEKEERLGIHYSSINPTKCWSMLGKRWNTHIASYNWWAQEYPRWNIFSLLLNGASIKLNSPIMSAHPANTHLCCQTHISHLAPKQYVYDRALIVDGKEAGYNHHLFFGSVQVIEAGSWDLGHDKFVMPLILKWEKTQFLAKRASD